MEINKINKVEEEENKTEIEDNFDDELPFDPEELSDEIYKKIDKNKKENSFKYNIPQCLDIDFSEIIEFPLKDIESDGYLLDNKVNHRPIRKAHVNKIKAAYSESEIPTIYVCFSGKDNKAHAVQHQHLLVAVQELVKYRKIPSIENIYIRIAKRKSNGELLDSDNVDDARICFKYSYLMTDPTEKNCISDTIAMILQLEKEYIYKTGKKHGATEYIYEKQYGYQKLEYGTINNYKSLGKKLNELDLLEKAQIKRWDKKMIIAMTQNYELGKQNIKMLEIPLTEWAYNEACRRGFDKSKFWHAFLANKDKKIDTNFIIEILSVFRKMEPEEIYVRTIINDEINKFQKKIFR